MIIIILLVWITLSTYVGIGLYRIGKEQERVGQMFDNLDNPMFYKIDYKGKYFMLADEVGDYDIEVGTIHFREIIGDREWLIDHINQCEYYGIPPYTGENKDLISLISRLQ